MLPPNGRTGGAAVGIAGVITTDTSSATTSNKRGSLWVRYRSIVLRRRKPHDPEAPPLSSPEISLVPLTPPSTPSSAPEQVVAVVLDQNNSTPRSELPTHLDSDHHHHNSNSTTTTTGEINNESEESDVINIWNAIVRSVQEKDLISLRKKSIVDWVDSLIKRFHSDQLNPEEGEGVSGTVQGQEPQAWNTRNEGKSFFHFLLQACNSFTILLLFVSAGLSFAIESIQQGAKDGWHDGAAVVVAIFVLVVFYSVGNFLRQKKLEKKMLNEKKKLSVKVYRNRNFLRLSVCDVMARDIICLKKGDQVPADGLFISESQNLKLDQVLNPEINRDRNPFLFAGSRVMEGRGLMIVTSKPGETALGETSSFDSHSDVKALLQALLDKTYDYIEKYALSMSVLTALVVLIRLLSKKQANYNELAELKGPVDIKYMMQVLERVLLKNRGNVSILASTIVTFVIGFQHGTPLVIGLCLGQFRKKLASNGKGDVQNPLAGVALGLASVIFIDATDGKLLCKETEVKEFWVGEKDIISENDRVSVLDAIQVWDLPKISVGSNDELVVSWVKSKWGGTEHEGFGDKDFQVVKYKRSISSKKSHGVLMRRTVGQEQSLELHWKGPALTILDMCTDFYDSYGEKHSMMRNDDQRKKFEKVVEDMENKGLRPIAFAFGNTEVEELKKEGLNLLAIVGLKYPCKEEIKILVDTLRAAGLLVKLVSEDELPIVKAIAWELGFFNPGSEYYEEIRKMVESGNVEEIQRKIIETTVMGDSHSKEKLHAIEQSKKSGQVVGFFGGLTARDTLALKKADVGITQENQCAEMARNLSDISSNDFPKGAPDFIMYSRCLYLNIQRFFEVQLTFWISGLTITFISVMLTGESPLTSLDMIWVNLIVCLLGGLIMVMELNGQEIHTNCRPAERTRSLINKAVWVNIAIKVCCQVFLLTIFGLIGHRIGPSNTDKDVLRSMIFNSFTFFQLFNLFNVMNLERMEVLEVVLQKHWFMAAWTAVVLTQVMVVQLGKGLLTSGRLNIRLWTICFILAASSLLFESIVKKLSSLFLRLSSPNSYLDLSNRRHWSSVSYLLAFPFSVLLLFSASYYFNPGIAHTSR